ncbi:MAG: dihydrolipoamide acetyltransferase family protein [Desulfuromusa sp.]
MAAEFMMPQLGLTMTEGTIIQWLKSVGDPVALGDVLVEVETEKINYQVESTLEGTLLAILAKEGDVAPVITPIAVIGKKGEKIESVEALPPASVEEVVSSEPAEDGLKQVTTVESGERIFVSPIAKRMAAEQGVGLEKIKGTGPNGRIVEKDIMIHLERTKVNASPLAVKIADEYQVDLASIDKNSRIMKDDILAKVPQDIQDPTTSTPLSGMRKVIAERMSISWHTAPHVNMTAEVDMTAAGDLKEKLTGASGIKISYTDIILKCSAQALYEFPILNSSLVESKIISHQQINIGIAVALDDGLIVPVLKNANHKTIVSIRNEINLLAKRAHDGVLDRDEISGGTFTVTNLGMFGVDHFTPIINYPESSILGVCRIVKRPVVINDVVEIRPLMNLCLSFDHRLVDGAIGAQFLARLRQLMEQPLLLL